jgi:hypothetical protein
MTSKFVIKETEAGTFLILTTTRGSIYCYNIDVLIKKHFS